MSVQQSVASDHQLVRLLQIGVVLEEVVEARAAKHADADDLDDSIRAFLREAAAESATHRERLDTLVDGLEADTIPFDEVKLLVEQQYEADQDFDGILYDQLCNEETAYKFYDDLIAAVEESDADFGLDRDHLLSVLREIRTDEKTGVEEVTALMEERA
ncbi:ferritin-like domain-containing protein [Salinibaculum rarum]|uniref:ferritin-like domain-containing protein n=1 Tax=Salinibaculum rarum TaxID=3058903 RepID=UPI00265DCA80|nr:ferritin-like domain-containing protein [Salinibaculum sp. KK48]